MKPRCSNGDGQLDCERQVIMNLLLVFSITLLLAVLFSGLAGRSVLSTAVLFLVVGFASSRLGWVSLSPEDSGVRSITTLALFSVLFTDGMRVGVKDLKSAWRLPGRALLLGMPLTMLMIAGAAAFLLGFAWQESLLLGAALSPTDPVFAAAIVGREEVPGRLRRLLNVESGINDGLALPLVVILLAMAGKNPPHPWEPIGGVIGGIAIGIALPWLVIKLERTRFFGAAELYEPLLAFAIGLTLYAVTMQLHWNEFLAAFAGGATIASICPEVREAFHQFGEVLAELLKLAALLVFGALMSLEVMHETSLADYAFVALVLFLARPVAIILSLLGSELDWQERLAAAWFGPKGFASVVYGLLILGEGLPEGQRLYHLIAFVVAFSIILHSSTDVALAKRFRESDADAEHESESQTIRKLEEPG